MPALLALGAALMYGSADFSGALATRRASVLTVLLLSQGVGLVVALGGSFLVGGALPQPEDLLWGAAAGLAGAIGIALLYTALATTLVAVASPIAAVGGALLPALFGIASGERPEPLAWAGIAAALPAIVLLTRGANGDGSRAEGDSIRRAVLLGLGAGAGFALFYIAISRTGHGSGLWPLVAARASTLVAISLISVLRPRSAGRGSDPMAEGGGRPARNPPSPVPPAVVAGFLDMGANIAFLLATRVGLLSIVTVVSSLYPAPTVILARLFFHERLTVSRVAGLALAVAAVACIGAG